jgi:hypothetical protein
MVPVILMCPFTMVDVILLILNPWKEGMGISPIASVRVGSNIGMRAENKDSVALEPLTG